ncbi:polysaccharide biosynthesis tyrosine autokinase [Adhaeribacter pallidiroseus]|uniref:non-specific protein-tyrosine kinase n=1 Tax=Adhaeribacter pallidiroseus TaxID=2072847 RepID=A0A369QP10_9BACT|nr:polysaccharide biosynthesis tyrosine autokinase [Adhaeribacter pallidiroseus]RDC64997.1 putative tyrosine-protein kinase in cps region [Adhaeribacter pallidiroseus]
MANKESIVLEELDNSNYASTIEVEEESRGSDIDFIMLLSLVRKSLIWVALLIVLGLIGSFLFLRYTKPLYKSSSTLKIDEQSEAGRLGLDGTIENQQNLSNLSGEIEIIKSNLTYERLQQKLPLDISYYAIGNILNEELYRSSPFHISYEMSNEAYYNIKFGVSILDATRYNLSYVQGDQEVTEEHTIGEPVQKPGFTFTLKLTAPLNSDILAQKYYFTINSTGAIRQYLTSNVAVNIVNLDASTVDISFTDHNPFKAHEIVNSIDSVYLEQKIALKDMATRQTLSFLDEQLKETNENLGNSEIQMENFVKQNKTYDVRADVNKQMTKLEDLNKQRVDLRMELSLLNEIDQLIGRNTSLDQMIPSLKELDDEQLSNRISQLSNLQLDRSLMMQSYKTTTKAYQLLEEEIDFSEKAVRKLLAQNKLLLQKEVNLIDTNIRNIQQELLQMPGKETQRARLQRLFDLHEKFYLMLMDKKVEFGIARAGTVPDFQILAPASRPAAPIYPNRLLVYGIGLAGGLFLGLGLIAGRYLLHNTITSLPELERSSFAAVLGVIPRYKKEKLPISKLIVDKNPKSAISESIRSVRTNLEFISSSKNKRLISITSTVSGEGKTFVAVNLGAIISQSNQRVIILDLDLRKPKIHQAFDAENTKGISTILIDRHSVAECIRRTSMPNLDFISAGPTPPNPAELILNSSFDDMVEELYHSYDVIIVDTPPVGLVTDGILVMRKADIPIYIVRAGFSKKTFLKNMNKIMRINNFNKMCTILNDADSMVAYGYGYGYSYGYGYGYSNSYYEEDQPESFVTRFKKRFT